MRQWVDTCWGTASLVREGLQCFVRTDLRWTHVIVLLLCTAGLIVHLTFPEGWTVWPVVLVASIMVGVNEAADRNGQGVPPLKVYALFAGVLMVWFLVTYLLSVLNPLILVVGVGALVYYVARNHVQQREVMKLVQERRLAGRCIHCGEPADSECVLCLNCGEEPDPEGAQLRRIGALARTKGVGVPGRARAVLKGHSATATVEMKERALMARRQRQTRRTAGG